MSFAQQMYGQIYALGKEIHVRGIPDPFQMRRSKRKFGEEPETYSETLRRLKEENYDILLESSRANIVKTANPVKKTVCNESNLISEERSDYLQVRCGDWSMPELDERAIELQHTPAGMKIYDHWQKTHDVYYLRRNLERFMTMQPLTADQYKMLSSGDMDGYFFPEDPSTDRQVLSDIGRLMNYGRKDGSTFEAVPPPEVKLHPDHPVIWQGTGVVAKGVPADREIQFFGFNDYREQGEGDVSGEGSGADYEDEDEDEEETQEVQAEKDDGQEGGSSGGMSNLEKALLATELAMVGKKLHGFVQGRRNGSGVEDQSTMTMKMKNAGDRAKMAGKGFYQRAGDKFRGTLMKGKKAGSKVGKGFKRVKGVLSKGVPILKKVGKVGMFLGKIGRRKRDVPEELQGLRKKRQALAIGATLLGGYVLNNEWDWIKDELGIGSGNAESGLVHAVQGNDDHLRILGTHVDGLEKATLKLRQKVTMGAMDEGMLVMFEQVVGLMEEIKDQYGRVYDAVNVLISQKKLSTALASPPDVYREISIVTAKLKRENMELLMEESQEVYDMEASYILFDNMTLAVFVHLPVGRLGESMRLYRFLPTPFRFENRTNFFMMNPNRELLASAESEKERQIELSDTDFEWCEHVRSTFYCPGRTQWMFDTRKSCLSALFRRDTPTIQKKCAISPIPHSDMSVQLDEKTFLVALEKEEVFRFTCKEKQVTSLKLSGLIRLTIPRGCMAEGDWMKLIPTHNLFFNVGKIRVVKVLPLEMMNLSASDYAVKSGEFTMGGGEAGPSVEDLMKTWKVNEKKEKRHFSLWTWIKRTFWTIIMFVVLFVIVQVVLKVVELWQLKNWAVRTGGKFKKLYEERDNMFAQIRDNVAHLKRLSHAVLGGRRPATVVEPAVTLEESVRLNDLARGEMEGEEDGSD